MLAERCYIGARPSQCSWSWGDSESCDAVARLRQGNKAKMLSMSIRLLGDMQCYTKSHKLLMREYSRAELDLRSQLGTLSSGQVVSHAKTVFQQLTTTT